MVDGKWKRAAEYWDFTIFHLPFAIQEMRFSAVLPGIWLAIRSSRARWQA
jgi:hypothetical protein